MTTISALVMASNEAEMLPGCLKLLDWADEVVVLVNDSSDEATAEIARRSGARVFVEPWRGFAGQRDRLAELATTDWIVYIDADERVSSTLAVEIRAAIEDERFATYSIPRQNVLLGRAVRHGGWWPDPQCRLIRRSALRGWVGAIHELPDVDGARGMLTSPIIHLGHRDIESMLVKTTQWSRLEAERRAARPRPVRVRTLLRTIEWELMERLIRRGGWRDGTEGWIEALYQAFSSFISVARAWELQRPETLEATYRRLDEHLLAGGSIEGPHSPS